MKINVGKMKVTVLERSESTTGCKIMIEYEQVEHVNVIYKVCLGEMESMLKILKEKCKKKT